MPWCKKNKCQLQKPEKKKLQCQLVNTVTPVNTVTTETPNMKTVTTSSKWSSASSCTSLLRENKIPSQVNKSRKLKPIL